MTDSALTPKQSYFLKRLQKAETAGLTIVQLAEQENVSAALLYNYRHVLRQKGHMAPEKPVRSGSVECRICLSAIEGLYSCCGPDNEYKLSIL